MLAVMTPLDCAQVRLAAAVLCQDCDTISNTPHRYCPACGSQSLFLLARVLNRQESDRQTERRTLDYFPSLEEAAACHEPAEMELESAR